MTDPLEEAFAYLQRAPKGTARVTAAAAKKSLRGRSGPVHVELEKWAEMHGFTITGDRPDLAVATTFYFRVKT